MYQCSVFTHLVWVAVNCKLQAQHFTFSGLASSTEQVKLFWPSLPPASSPQSSPPPSTYWPPYSLVGWFSAEHPVLFLLMKLNLVTLLMARIFTLSDSFLKIIVKHLKIFGTPMVYSHSCKMVKIYLRSQVMVKVKHQGCLLFLGSPYLNNTCFNQFLIFTSTGPLLAQNQFLGILCKYYIFAQNLFG